MFFYKIIKSIIGILHSQISPNEIAFGAALGAFIGLSPYMTLHNLIIFLLIFLLKVNVGSAFLSVGVFAVIGRIFDPLSDAIGYVLLVNINSLTPFWTKLYNMPLVPFTKFYNTIVLGSFVIAVLLFVPIFYFSKWFINYYRLSLQAKIQNWKIMKIFKLSSIFNMYDKYQK
ncbi:MAG: TIGR03546 family protein [Elusimicrobia bacterium]|nr:TIGR03546 family protein [Elusimicrobiota bacterium]